MSATRKGSMTTATACRRFADVLKRAAGAKERVVLTRAGKPVAAVVPFEDLQALEALEDQVDTALLSKAREQWREEGGATVSLGDLAAKHGIRLPDRVA